MSAHLENQYAVKWTHETVEQQLGRIGHEAENGEDTFLGDVLRKLHLSRRSWSYWKKKFAGDEHILDQMDIIEGIFESKVWKAGANGTLPVAMAIFSLKCNHHWTDRPPMMVLTEQPARTPLTIYMGEDTQVIP